MSEQNTSKSGDAQSGSAMNNPKCILLFSGKRKSGKDHLTEWLVERVNGSKILRLSGPIKKVYADSHGLDFESLLSSGTYKEQHRLDMIKWSEEIRKKDHGYFVRHSIEMYSAADSSVWIVSDCRRTTDVTFFKHHYDPKVIAHVRVEASDEVRRDRGWVFQAGVDDAESECGLDKADFDIVVRNDGDASEETALQPVLKWIKSVMDKCK